MAGYVQKSSPASFGGGTTAAPSITGVAANSLLVAIATWFQGAANASPPTIGSGWSTAVNPSGNTAAADAGYSEGVTMFYLESASAGTHNPTITLPNAGYGEVEIREFSGAALTSALRAVASNVVSTTASTLSSGTTNGTPQTGDIVVVAVAGGARTFTDFTIDNPPTGYSNGSIQASSNVTCPSEVASAIAGSGGAKSASWAISPATSYTGAIAVFAAAGGGGAAAPVFLNHLRTQGIA